MGPYRDSSLQPASPDSGAHGGSSRLHQSQHCRVWSHCGRGGEWKGRRGKEREGEERKGEGRGGEERRGKGREGEERRGKGKEEGRLFGTYTHTRTHARTERERERNSHLRFSLKVDQGRILTR